MQKDQPKKGDRVYIRGGVEAEYVATVDPGYRGGRFIVRPIEVGGSPDDPWEEPGDPVEVSRVSIGPPKQKVDQEIVDANAELRRLKGRLKEAKDNLDKLTKDQLDRLEKLKAIAPALHRIEDVLAGRITHVVVSDWQAARILPFAEFIATDDRFDKGGIRLLSLYGDSNGDPLWKVNQYSDGSGSWRWCIPCTSEEEAREQLATFITDLVADNPTNPYHLAKARDAADLAGLPFPAAIREQVRDNELKAQSAKVSKAQKDLDKEATALQALAHPTNDQEDGDA